MPDYRVAKQSQHRVGKGITRVANQAMLARDNWQAFDPDRRGSNRAAYRHRFERFDPRSATYSQRNDVSIGGTDVSANVIDKPREGPS